MLTRLEGRVGQAWVIDTCGLETVSGFTRALRVRLEGLAEAQTRNLEMAVATPFTQFPFSPLEATHTRMKQEERNENNIGFCYPAHA